MLKLLHHGVIAVGAAIIAVIFGGFLVLSLLRQVLLGDPFTSHRIVARMGPTIPVIVQALPFLLVGLAVYWKSSSKTALRIAAVLLLGIYAIVNYRTELLQEAAFRMTPTGREFRDFRQIVQACHEGHANNDLGLNSRYIRMRGCLDSLPQSVIDDWCNKIFKEKKPFKDHNESTSCYKRSMRLAGVAKWPLARDFVDVP